LEVVLRGRLSILRAVVFFAIAVAVRGDLHAAVRLGHEVAAGAGGAVGVVATAAAAQFAEVPIVVLVRTCFQVSASRILAR